MSFSFLFNATLIINRKPIHTVASHTLYPSDEINKCRGIYNFTACSEYVNTSDCNTNSFQLWDLLAFSAKLNKSAST